MKKKLTAMVLALDAMLGAFGAWNGNLSTLKGDATAASGTVKTGASTAAELPWRRRTMTRWTPTASLPSSCASCNTEAAV